MLIKNRPKKRIDSLQQGSAKLKTIHDLIDLLHDKKRKPCILKVQKSGLRIWTFRAVYKHVKRLAAGLSEQGISDGKRVGIFAPNSAEWIIAFLALCKNNAVPVLIDSHMPGEDIIFAINDNELEWLFTTQSLSDYLDRLKLSVEPKIILLDQDHAEDNWKVYLRKPLENSREQVSAEALAAVFYTSGTSGLSKAVPLTHKNLISNLNSILELNLVGRNDRIFLPLPLTHAYSFTIGMLLPMASGAPIVFPFSLTGDQLIRALNIGRVTVFVGVPRMYEVLFEAIERKVLKSHFFSLATFYRALYFSISVKKSMRLNLGASVFYSFHRSFAPKLRLLATGGSEIAPELAWKMEGLGWQVITGYGLTETSPVLTVMRPGLGRFDSVGKAIKDVQIRIAKAEMGMPYGEILVKGPSVFNGYQNAPDRKESDFDEDRYFRTGDLGFFDEDGYLYLRGRSSTMIQLSAFEKIDLEKVEAALAESQYIKEAGVLAQDGQVHALIVPAKSAYRDIIGKIVEEKNQKWPPHLGVSRFKLTQKPIPRTRLGKIRRHKLQALYEEVACLSELFAQKEPRSSAEHVDSADHDLLERGPAKVVWGILSRRYSDFEFSMGSNLEVDLGIDSIEWINITLDIQECADLVFQEQDIQSVGSVRDLIRKVVEISEEKDRQSIQDAIRAPEKNLDPKQTWWIKAPGVSARIFADGLLTLDRIFMNRFFSITNIGQEHLSPGVPCLLLPNHISTLDAPALAAALPKALLKNTYWVGAAHLMFRNPLLRFLSKSMHIIPMDPEKEPVSSLALARSILNKGYSLVWFAEKSGSSRSDMYRLFETGIAYLLKEHAVPIIPVKIEGSDRAMSMNSLRPSRNRITVTFGQAIRVDEMRDLIADKSPDELMDVLHSRIAEGLKLGA